MGMDAVIFDWGGTLTPWHTVDFDDEARALAEAAVEHDLPPEEVVAKLRDANQTVWGRSRDHHQSATVADLFNEAGIGHDIDLLTAYREFWRPHTETDPEAVPLFTELRERGIKVGILSNTIWPRGWHREIFERDGLLDLIDGDVYTSELPWTKPSERAFRAAMDAVGATDPARCAFVGDRLYDDIWGAHNAGLRAIHVPHSDIPPEQIGHSEGEPDAVAHRLLDVGAIVAGWS
ncbi:HAD family hydrolase [Nocardioides speluncae]|uniref:HAD family hydrolase n=1 Tax=Nocardioides speluncae TaxID=2670337 RepID=UPI000D68A267|nr:HAD family hydrolase [Nocardioides speluncae]